MQCWVQCWAQSPPQPALAQSKPFPDHAVRLIVPFTAGGNADVVARMVAQGMGEQLKHPVIVENQPGRSRGNAALRVATLGQGRQCGRCTSRLMYDLGQSRVVIYLPKESLNK